MKSPLLPLVVLGVVVFGALTTACRKPPPVENHYYSIVLEATELPPAAGSQPPTARVDLLDVHLPDFLKSRSLVLQVNSNEVRHARHHHWGEPLHDGIRKVLARDLSVALPSLDIAPGPGHNADCTLQLDFDRFHATDDSRVVVSGRYTWNNGENTVRRDFDVTQVQHGDGYTNAVKAMRHAVRALSNELQPVVAGCTPKSPKTPKSAEE